MITGDFAKLDKLISGMKAVRNADLRRALNKQLALESRNLVHDGFQASRTPFGARWAPVKRLGSPLMDTRRLYNSISYNSSARGFSLKTNVVYAAVHNYGYRPRNIKRRQFFPGNRTPPGWRGPLQAVGRLAFKRFAASRF